VAVPGHRRLVPFAAHCLQDVLDQGRNPIAVRRGDGPGGAQPELVELGAGERTIQAFGLVDHQPDALPAFAQTLGDHGVLGRESLAAVGEENDRVGLGDGAERLARHLLQQARAGRGLEAAGIDDQKRLRTDPAPSVVTIAGDAGRIGDDGRTRARQPVEKGRLADVRASYDDDRGQQGRFLTRRGR
jgi:hypothetical protein